MCTTSLHLHLPCESGDQCRRKGPWQLSECMHVLRMHCPSCSFGLISMCWWVRTWHGIGVNGSMCLDTHIPHSRHGGDLCSCSIHSAMLRGHAAAEHKCNFLPLGIVDGVLGKSPPSSAGIPPASEFKSACLMLRHAHTPKTPTKEATRPILSHGP